MTSITPTACSEHELIVAARQGDDRAFEELYARYRGRVGAFINRRVGDYGRGEDVAQEVFISALRRLRANDRPIQFKPWIYEIARNACIDEYRRTSRAREVSLDVEPDAGGPRPLLSLAPSPPVAVETKQRLQDLRGAFGGLSESHHQLLVLRELEGLSYEDIGARTGMSRQMVESALFRARRKLTEEYDQLASGQRCQQVQGAIQDGRALSLRSFGLRERRQFARHLAHCQPCRMAAHLAGVDESLVKPRKVGGKIAALLPFPLWRWPWGGARAARNAAVRTGSHPVALHSLQNAAAFSQPVSASALGAAAVAAAVLTLAGGSVGLAPGAAGHHPAALPSHPAQAQGTISSRVPTAPTANHGLAAIHGASRKTTLPALGRAHIGLVSRAPRHPAAAPAALPPRHRGSASAAPESIGPSQPSPAGALPGLGAASPSTGTAKVPGPIHPVATTLGDRASSTLNTVTKVVGAVPSGSQPPITGPASGVAPLTTGGATGATGPATSVALPAVPSTASTLGATTGSSSVPVKAVVKSAVAGN